MMLNDLLIAHRGIYNNKTIPENSLLAFNLAIKNNFPIECDVRITKDKNLIVFHDKNLKRMTGVDKNASCLKLRDVNKYNLLKTKEKIPTLKEVLRLVSGRVMLLIEVKYSKDYKVLVDKLFDSLKKYKGLVIIQSFSIRIIKYLKNKDVKYKYGLLVGKNFPMIFLKYLVKVYDVDFLSVSKYISGNKYVKSSNKNIILWTIKNKKELNKYRKKDYSYICNNLPYW